MKKFIFCMCSILHLALLCSVNLLSLAPSIASAATEENTLRVLTLATNTTLELSIPKSWKEQLQQPPRGRPILLLTPSSGTSFQVLITPVWIDRPEMALPGIEDIRRNVTSALEQARPQAVEATLTLKDVMSSYSRGYYFTATDKTPREGEFKYMTQGMLRNGELLLMFTILTNDGGETVIANALSALKNTKLKVPAKPAPAPAIAAPRKTSNDK